MFKALAFVLAKEIQGFFNECLEHTFVAVVTNLVQSQESNIEKRQKIKDYTLHVHHRAQRVFLVQRHSDMSHTGQPFSWYKRPMNDSHTYHLV